MRFTSLLPALAGLAFIASPAFAGNLPTIPTGAHAGSMTTSAVTGAAAASGGNWSAAAAAAGGKSYGIATEAGDPYTAGGSVNWGWSSASGQFGASQFGGSGWGAGFSGWNGN